MRQCRKIALRSSEEITHRLVPLRKDYLIRDRQRGIISRTFDDGEAIRHVARNGNEEARDDDRESLRDESSTFAPLLK